MSRIPGSRWPEETTRAMLTFDIASNPELADLINTGPAGDWILNVAYEHYDSSADLAIQSVSLENPALVSYDLFSAGFTTRF